MLRSATPGNQFPVVKRLSFGFATVLAIESLDSTGCIDELLLACEEGVAIGADFKPDFRLRGARLPGLAARAMHGRLHIFRMNIGLHFLGHSCQKFLRQQNTVQ
jgi:hypothetical protein